MKKNSNHQSSINNPINHQSSINNHQSNGFSILFVDDEPSMLRLLAETFAGQGYRIHRAGGGLEALALLKQVQIDAALIDLAMPQMDGLELLKRIRKEYPALMVVMLTGQAGIKEAVAAVKLGADDFLEKPFSPEALRVRVAQLFRIWQLKEENRRLQAQVENQFAFSGLVGNSTAMLKLKELIAEAGRSDSTVLIQGETGTGKELTARALHAHSPRAKNRFVPVDCAAISETVIESELFGHIKGAFTGAHISTPGLIRSADKGSLFLDEVGELSPALQAKLLRTIQERVVRPVGSSRGDQVDIRLLAATNRNLAAEMAGGRFREDLFYRLNVLTINVPPLRDHPEDIPLLTNYFLKRFATELSTVKDVSRAALECLENYTWPGNVRELENAVRRAVALGRGKEIHPEDLPPPIFSVPAKAVDGRGSVAGSSLAAYEKAAIQNALAMSNHNRMKTAKILKIGEATLYRKIKKYGIED